MNEEHAATIAHIRLVFVELEADLDGGDFHGLAENSAFLGQLCYRALQHERVNRELSA